MEAMIKISVTTIIVSRREKASGQLTLLVSGSSMRGRIGAISTATPHRAHTSRQKASRRMRDPPDSYGQTGKGLGYVRCAPTLALLRAAARSGGKALGYVRTPGSRESPTLMRGPVLGSLTI